jgi:hypothetical protein
MSAIDQVAEQLAVRARSTPPTLRHRRAFIDTYRRTTLAVGSVVDAGGFEDPQWVTRWDVQFAGLFLSAVDADLTGRPVPRPWRLAFDAPAQLPTVRHVLLGMNAHVNYDLPQSLLAVITDQEFADPAVLARRLRDHERIDAILASRVGAEDAQIGGPRTLLDQALTPLNRRGVARFLREARRKVWHNTTLLQQARTGGADRYTATLSELEVLSAARIADLLAPGQVILKLAIGGFGVLLPPPPDPPGAPPPPP